MYRYTPNKQMLEDLRRKKRKDLRSYSSLARNLAAEHFGRYDEQRAFLNDWPHVEFYSKTRVHFVPVRGFLFPLKFFDEVTIADKDAKPGGSTP